MDDIYLDRPNLYIGFHGCEKKSGDRFNSSS